MIDSKILDTTEYKFLKENEHLGKNICLLVLGGSHAYGTNVEGSDVDIRGIALNSKREILLGKDFEQVVDTPTDTTIYSFHKILQLLANCNPNVIEMLGTRPDHRLFVSEIGQELIDNRHMFLSKRAIYTFGGYANAQLRRLQNKAMHNLPQKEREKHILKSIEHAKITFREQVSQFPEDAFRIYPDLSKKEDFDTEMFVDVHLDHYPLRDLSVLYQDVNAIIRDYDKIGKRNANAYTHSKIAKHSMHLLRLYMMAIDILLQEEIITYRSAEHDLLMSVRNGDFLNELGEPIPEFFKIVDDLEKQLDEATKTTKLPDSADMVAIQDFEMRINEKIVRGEI